MTSSPHPSFLVEASREAAVVRFTEPVLGEQLVQGVRLQSGWLVHAPGRRQLRLDLEAVTAPTAAGLGRLVALHHELQATGGELVLCNVGPTAYEAFARTGLTRLLDVRPTEGCAA